MTQSATPILRIGTRGSPLALVQAHMVRTLAAHVLGFSEEEIELKIIRTSGDMIQDRPLSEVGGKGLFTKEQFCFSAETNSYTCPGVEILVALHRRKIRDNHQGF